MRVEAAAPVTGFVTVFATVLASSVAMGIGATAVAAPPRFTAQFIAGGANPAAINESGTIVGTNHVPMRAWVSRDGGPAVLLPLPAGAASSWATDVNDLGVVVGAVSASSSPEFNGRAVAWVPIAKGVYAAHELGTLPGQPIGNATALNNLGDIVGYTSNGTYRFAALFRIGSPVTSLGATGLFDPQDVNDRRVVVDRSFTCKRLDLDTMQIEDLGTPGTGYIASTATAVNEHDQVAGLVIRATSGSCDREAARYTDELGWQMFSVCGPYNGAQDINDRGDLVMTIQLASYLRIDGQGTHLIESLIDADTGVWTVYTLAPLSINNKRQIATSATNSALGLSGCVRLTPDTAVGDVDGDGAVGPADLAALLSAWGPCAGCNADLDGDGFVDALDLAAILDAWNAGD